MSAAPDRVDHRSARRVSVSRSPPRSSRGIHLRNTALKTATTRLMKTDIWVVNIFVDWNFIECILFYTIGLFVHILLMTVCTWTIQKITVLGICVSGDPKDHFFLSYSSTYFIILFSIFLSRKTGVTVFIDFHNFHFYKNLTQYFYIFSIKYVCYKR